MRQSDGITESMNMSLSQTLENTEGQGRLGVLKSARVTESWT